MSLKGVERLAMFLLSSLGRVLSVVMHVFHNVIPIKSLNISVDVFHNDAGYEWINMVQHCCSCDVVRSLLRTSRLVIVSFFRI